MEAAEKVVTHVKSTFASNLVAKTINFLRRSIWKYLLATLLLTVTTTGMFGHFSSRFFLFLSIVLVISFMAILMSSWRPIGGHIDAVVTFDWDKMLINHKDKGAEEITWDYVSSINFDDKVILLKMKPVASSLNSGTSFLFLTRSNLSPEEILFFEQRAQNLDLNDKSLS